jgi:hypothetical protein
MPVGSLKAASQSNPIRLQYPTSYSNLSTSVGRQILPRSAAYLTNDSQSISVPEHCKKLRIELNDASVPSCRIRSLEN